MNLFNNIKSVILRMFRVDEQMHNKLDNYLNGTTIYDLYNIYDAWSIADSRILSETYKTVNTSMNNAFWNTESNRNLCKRTTAISKVVLDALVNIVTENYNGIVIDNEKYANIWKDIEKQNDFFDLLMKAVKQSLVLGGGAFKITFDSDKSEFPALSFVSYKKCLVEYDNKELSKITFFDRVYYKNDNKYILHEIYEKGKISYKLFNDDDTEVSLTTLEQTSNLKDIEFTDKNFMAAVHYKIIDSSRYEGLGSSIYESKLDILDALDETFTNYMLTIRLSAPKIFISEDCYKIDPKSGRRKIKDTIFNPFFVLSNQNPLECNSKIQLVQSTLNSDEYGKTMSQLISLFCADLISLSTINLNIENTALITSESGEAIREKEKQTLYTINKIKNSLFNILPQLVVTTLSLYDMINNRKTKISESDITIDFSDYINPSLESKIETIKKGTKDMILLTPEEVVDELYGYTLTDEEKEKLTEKLYILNYNVKSIDELIAKKQSENTINNNVILKKEDY